MKPLGLTLLFLTACPQTNATQPVITEAVVEAPGSEYTNSFSLKVGGRGFGLARVSYNQKEGTGVADSPSLGFRLLKEGAPFGQPFSREAVTVVSSQLLLLQVTLSSPLEIGRYGIEIHEGEQVVALEADVFQIDGDPPPFDAGPRDLGLADAPNDAGVDMDGDVPDQGPPPDMGPPDTGPVDMGPPDAGLVFPGNFAVRQPVVSNHAVEIAAGVTLRVPVSHAQLVMAGQSRADGLDLVVYQNDMALARAFVDPAQLGTDNLELVVKLAAPLPVGSPDLFLYYSDPTAMVAVDESVFEYVQRFDTPAAPVQDGNDAAWFVADDWVHCDYNYPVEATGQPDGAYCYRDFDDGFQRRTLATPRATTISNAPGPNQRYEMKFFMTADMNFALDILYLAAGPSNNNFPAAPAFVPADYTIFPPADNRNFPETNGSTRNVTGWHVGPNLVWWQPIELRFIPAADQPSFHFRYLSENDSNQVAVALDDIWVRLSHEPRPTVTLGTPQTR